MLMIRFQRIGRTNDPAFRIVVLEKERAAKSGSIVEQLGTYNPRSKALTLNEESVKNWIAKGAQPTGSIHNLLINKGVLSGKKVNVLSKKTPIKKEGETPTGAPADGEKAQTAAPAEVEAPTEQEVAAEAEGADVGSTEPAPLAGQAVEEVKTEEAPVAEEAPKA